VLNQLCFLISLGQFIVEKAIQENMSKMAYFDLFLLILSAPGVYLMYIPVWKTNSHGYEVMKQLIHFFKAAQVIRCYRVLLCFSGARKFLYGFFKILPKVSSLLGFFLMVLFIGAVLAQDLFGNIRYFGSIGPHEINFDNFFNSLFSLFSITTG
jgi:hypothetical protein